MPANPTPADARALAEEAIRLAEAATPGPWHVSNSFDIECDTCGEIPYVCDLTAEHEDGTAYQSLSMQFCGLESLAKPNAALVAHAGTHYATLARALIEALDERDSWRAEATKRADERHAATCDRLEMEKAMLRARDEREALLADLRGISSRAADAECLANNPERAKFEQIVERADAAIARLEARIK